MSQLVTEESRAHRRAKNAANKRANRKTVNGIGAHQTRMSWEPSTAALAELRKSIPPDTRDLTGRFFGDPVFERSALAMRRQQ